MARSPDKRRQKAAQKAARKKEQPVVRPVPEVVVPEENNPNEYTSRWGVFMPEQ